MSFKTIFGLMVLALVGGALFNGGKEAGWWLLGALGLLLFAVYTVSVFLAGVVLARRLINDGASVSSFHADTEAKKARAYSDMMVAGLKAGQQHRSSPAPVPAPMLGVGGFTIDGLDQDYEAFGGD